MSAVLEKEQFIVDASGERVGVLLDLDTYERLREAEEDLDDIRAYDAAAPRVRAEIAKGDFVTLSDYRKARAKRK
jgi:PHD/YefM family antitoxin component YafN of YafNO toxin-antitoxin module